MLVALLQGFVRQATPAWNYTLNYLGIFYGQALAGFPAGPLPDAKEDELRRDLIGSYLEIVRLLAKRTAELHVTLAGISDDPAFAPEPYNDFYRHGLYHGMLGRQGRVADRLRSTIDRLPESVRADARAVLERQPAIRERLRYFRDQRFSATRIRIHGDYHLGQVLYTGKDFVHNRFRRRSRPSRSASAASNAPRCRMSRACSIRSIMPPMACSSAKLPACS